MSSYCVYHTEDLKRMKSEQMKKKYSNGSNPRSRVVIVESDRCISEYFSLRNASRCEGVSPSVACGYVNGKKKQEGKSWRYA